MIKHAVIENRLSEIKSGLTFDLDAMIHNAEHCRTAANKTGFALRAVLKGGYIDTNIVQGLSGLGGISLAVGNATEASLPAVRNVAVATLYPSPVIAVEACSNVVRTTEVATSGVRPWSRKPDVHRVLLAIETREKREGLDCTALRKLTWSVRAAFGRRVTIDGFQLNYGCVAQEAPDAQSVNVLLKDLAQESLTLPVISPVLSLGGSALLPMLDKIKVPAMFRPELRIGEAVVAGSIPGQETSPDLLKTASYRAEILQVLPRKSSVRTRLLVNVGGYVLDASRRTRQTGSLEFESIGSQVSVVSVPQCIVHKNFISLSLDYTETERALARGHTSKQHFDGLDVSGHAAVRY